MGASWLPRPIRAAPDLSALLEDPPQDELLHRADGDILVSDENARATHVLPNAHQTIGPPVPPHLASPTALLDLHMERPTSSAQISWMQQSGSAAVLHDSMR